MKMKNKFLIIASVALASVGVTSCSDFLEEDNPNAPTTVNYGYKLSDCESAVTAVYNSFRQPNMYGFSDNLKRTDLVLPGRYWASSNDPMYNHTFNNNNQTAASQWEELYRGIFRANQAIFYLNRAKPNCTTEAMLASCNELEAQARFFRGLFYFYLNISFNGGNVPYFDYVPFLEEDFYQDIKSSEFIKEKYRADLLYAYNMLPRSYSDKTDQGRITKGAAAAVLGKSYLYDGDYSTAAQYFKDIIDSGVYTLVEADQNQTANGEFNAESILEISYTTQFNTEYGVWSSSALHNIYNKYTAGNGGWSILYPSCWLTDAYAQEPVDTLVVLPQETAIEPIFMSTDSLVIQSRGNNSSVQVMENGKWIDYKQSKTFGYIDYVHRSNLSLRASASVAIPQENSVGYYKATPTNYIKNGAVGYFKLYSNCYDVQTERDMVPSDVNPVNVRLIRYADVLLMYAECLIEGGTNDAALREALKYVNVVRHRGGTTLKGLPLAPNDMYQDGVTATYQQSDDEDLIDSAQKLMDHLMYVERPLELNIEGFNIRYYDLRRWGLLPSRFAELSTQEFVLMQHDSYYASDAGNVNVNGNECPTMKAGRTWGKAEPYDPENSKHADKDIYVNYFQASVNYTDAENAYYPVPSKEVISNPKILTSDFPNGGSQDEVASMND